jgi:glutamate synthase (ferredoxin)
MKFSARAVALVAAPITAFAFMQPTQFQNQLSRQNPETTFNYYSNVNAGSHVARSDSLSSKLQMAFELKEGETTNMFDGPLPITQERDACGVGFISNTQSGGKMTTVVSSND